MPTVPFTKTSRRGWLWFGLAITGIFLASLLLRFWGLSRFNSLVFDEVYYAKFASAFLKREIVFTGHPPLSTYIIAFGIWLGEGWWGDLQPQNNLAGLELAPLSYRWLNALTGSFIPLLVGAIAYLLTQRRSYALIATLLIAADGLFLVESRYALNNVYLISLGLWGHIFFLLALRASSWRRWLWLVLAGIGLGGAAAIKWNGLGFLLGAGGIWLLAWLISFIQLLPALATPTPQRPMPASPLQNLTQLKLGHALVAFAIVPALTYYASWLPYIQVDGTDNNFWQLQTQTLDYHERVGGVTAHPYCSLWYSWPLMLRPVAYFYQTVQAGTAVAPNNPALEPLANAAAFYDVHAMGNPILWWFSTVAVLLLGMLLLQPVWKLMTVRAASSSYSDHQSSPKIGTLVYLWTVAYLLVNWAANLLPWVKVTRCLFIYHYMESLIFATMLLALLIDRWFQGTTRQRNLALLITGLILIGFLFWMPLYLGLPLSAEGLQIRRWLPSWI